VDTRALDAWLAGRLGWTRQPGSSVRGSVPGAGTRPVINAAATLTTLGGPGWRARVAAMAEAAEDFVDLPELQRRVGERLAELTGNEAGYVTCGRPPGSPGRRLLHHRAKPARLEVPRTGRRAPVAMSTAPQLL